MSLQTYIRRSCAEERRNGWYQGNLGCSTSHSRRFPPHKGTFGGCRVIASPQASVSARATMAARITTVSADSPYTWS
jgi:hypothetical protein